MLYTISDFSREYEGSVRLIAGSDGVSRAVSGVGILDYELMPGLKNKYQRVNFSSDEIVLTHLLYAKDDPYLITEAVKYLVANGNERSHHQKRPAHPDSRPSHPLRQRATLPGLSHD